MVPSATNVKNFETDFKVSSQSRKFEFKVFNILKFKWPLSMVSIKPISTTTTTNFESKQSD